MKNINSIASHKDYYHKLKIKKQSNKDNITHNNQMISKLIHFHSSFSIFLKNLCIRLSSSF